MQHAPPGERRQVELLAIADEAPVNAVDRAIDLDRDFFRNERKVQAELAIGQEAVFAPVASGVAGLHELLIELDLRRAAQVQRGRRPSCHLGTRVHWGGLRRTAFFQEARQLHLGQAQRSHQKYLSSRFITAKASAKRARRFSGARSGCRQFSTRRYSSSVMKSFIFLIATL